MVFHGSPPLGKHLGPHRESRRIEKSEFNEKVDHLRMIESGKCTDSNTLVFSLVKCPFTCENEAWSWFDWKDRSGHGLVLQGTLSNLIDYLPLYPSWASRPC